MFPCRALFRVHLIASAPGQHQGDQKIRFGHLKLREVKFPEPCHQSDGVICVCSSQALKGGHSITPMSVKEELHLVRVLDLLAILDNPGSTIEE